MIQVEIVIITTVNNDLHRHHNPNYHRQPVSQNLSRVVTLRRFLLIHLSTVLNWKFLSSWQSFDFHEGCHLESSLLCNCHTVGGSISLCVQYCRIISDAVFVHVPKLLKIWPGQFYTIKLGIGPIGTKTWNSKISPAWLWLQSFKPKADPQGLKYLSLDQDSHLNLKKIIVRWVVNVFLCSNQQHLMHSSWSCQWFSLVWGERPWELGCPGGRTGRTWWMIQEKFNSRYCRNPVWYQDSLEKLNSISERDKFCCKSKNTCHHGQSTPRWCWEATRHHHPRRPPPWSLTTKPKDFWLCQFPISFMLQTGVYVPRVLISPQHFRKKTMPIWYRAYLLLLAWPCVLIFQHSMLLTKLDIMWEAYFC